MTVLKTARAMRYEIGTNLKGRAAAATWTQLLPSLEVRTAVVVGRVVDAEREALEQLAEHLVIVDGDGALPGGAGQGERSVDLVRVGRGGRALLERSPTLVAALAPRFSERAALYEDAGDRTAPGGHGRSGDLVGLPARRDLVVAPRLGRARVIAPTEWAPAVLSLPAARSAASLAGRIGPRRLGLGRTADRLLSSRLLARRPERGARLWTRHPADGPPEYIAAIARGADIEVGDCAWGLVAPGDYASQKVLLLLLDPRSGHPDTIVKLGSNAADAGRLRNEADALTRLASLAPAGGLVPALRFAGENAGRGVVGEGWIEGRPFEAVATGPQANEQYGTAAAWLTALASATVARRASAEVGSALRELFDCFRQLVPLSAAEMADIDDAVRAIESHAGTLPVVFAHGDPGTWNLMIADDRRPAFLDWESAEPEGLPLWDLLHLQGAFGSLVARREGVRGMEGRLRHLTRPTTLHARFAADVAALAAAVALPPSLIAPVAYTAWMHRALKEVTRRTPSTLERGPYLRFLRAMLVRRHEPGVRHLLAAEAAESPGP